MPSSVACGDFFRATTERRVDKLASVAAFFLILAIRLAGNCLPVIIFHSSTASMASVLAPRAMALVTKEIASRSEVWCRSQTRLLLQHFKRPRTDLECEGGFVINPTTDSKNLSGYFPNMTPAPLNSVSSGWQRSAEVVESSQLHCGEDGKRADDGEPAVPIKCKMKVSADR